MTDYRELFGTTTTDLDRLIAEGLQSGGSWCDLYFENTIFTDLLLRDSVVGSGGSHVDYGCGIRVLNGEKTGYAYSETTDIQSLLRAARAASSIAANGGGGFADSSRRLTQNWHNTTNLYPMAKDWRTADVGGLVPFLEKLDAEIRRRDGRVSKVVAMLSYSVSEIMMYTSQRELICDCRPLASLNVEVVAQQGGKTESRSVSRSLRKGVEFLDPGVLDDLARRAVAGLDESFEATRPKGGKMPVVMGAGASGILLHEAMGHAFEADFNRKGQSIFSDKMGQKICPAGINIVDDGTLAGSRGAINYDDEGIRSQKTYMVTDGVLTSYLHDRISAAYYGVEPTGNGRRESFRYNPIPRMRTTYMENGSSGANVQDLVAEVRKGIFVDQFANGQVKIGEGDFTFYVKSGWTIENGRLVQPVKDLNIIGNGPSALSSIRAVASDLRIDESTWTCGKEQSVAVGCGIPSVLIDDLTVGGE